MASNAPTRNCAYCKLDKSWIFSGKKLKDGSKIYTNEFAIRWAGRRCPDCEKQRVNAAIKCDSFERDVIIFQLKQAGFTILGQTLPIKVEKDGQIHSVGIRHASAENGKITLNKAPKEKADIYALVFSSVRIFTKDQITKLEEQAQIYHIPKQSIKNKAIENPLIS